MFITDTGCEIFFPSPVDQKDSDPVSESASKKLFLSSQKNDLGCLSRIRIFFHPGYVFFSIPDPGVIKKHLIPDKQQRTSVKEYLP
jgi:hypothetical protein